MSQNGRVLLEREKETLALSDVISRLTAGEGSMTLVEGPAGIGKTSLLDHAERIGREADLQVRVARGGVLEHRMPFGIVRQLLEPLVERAGEEERSRILEGTAALSLVAFGPRKTGGEEVDAFAPVHGLYWLLANIAEDRPCLLLVDDVQWADSESIRWLDFVARRATDIPVAVVAAVRSGEPGEPDELEDLRSDSHASLRPSALSASAQSDLARAWLGLAPADEVLAACDASSRGNPFLLEQLLRTLCADGLEPRDPASARAIPDIAPESVIRSVGARVRSCGVHGAAIARAVAVLGEHAQLRHVAALAETGEKPAAQAVDRLRSADILASGGGLRYAHPLVRTAVYRAIPVQSRSTLHRSAAELLEREGAEASAIASHLLLCLPNGDEWVAAQLAGAARDALDAGAPDTARRYLERALEEPTLRSSEMRHDLARALWRTSPLDALGAAADVAIAADDPELRLEAMSTAAWACFDCGDMNGAIDWLRRLAMALPDQRIDERREAEANLSCISLLSEGRSAATSRRIGSVALKPPADQPGVRLARQAMAFDDFLAGQRIDQVVGLAQQFSPPPWTGRGPIPAISCRVLACCGEWDAARSATASGWESARLSGVLHVASYRESFLSEIDRLAGRLTDSEAEARTAWEIVREFSPMSVPALLAIANLIATLVTRGRTDEASGLADDWDLSAPFSVVPISPILLETRGLLRLGAGDLAGGADDLLTAGEDLELLGFVNPAASSWRHEVVPALASLGRAQEASALAKEGEARARQFGAPHVIGMMLRARAAVEPRKLAQRTLLESVAGLRAGGPPHELARSLLELGAGLRRAGSRREAREPLLEALELAERSGAEGTATRAREELAPLGSRPRSAFRTGVEALTASELRTAKLAAEGMTNTEIAQRLFVTTKTVEKHLSNAYTKLEIETRRALPEALRSSGS